MKHESNDTPPFAPDDPISRSLFVRPNLIERLCASALRLCLLVCIPAAASVFLISLADSAEAACTSEPSQHYEVTTLIADHPVQTSSDPDFEEILKANARIAVESGEWSRRVKRKEETLIQWMRSPVFPEFRPMAVKTTLVVFERGAGDRDAGGVRLAGVEGILNGAATTRVGGLLIFGQRVLIFTQSRVVLENRIDDFELGVLVVAQVTLSGCDGTARGREGLVAVKDRVGDHNVAFRADEECAAAVGVTDDRITDELRVRDVGNLQDRHCATGIGLIFRECRVFDIQNIVGARCRQELRNGAALAGSILRECRVFNIDRAAIEDECAALRPVDGIAIGGLRNESGRVVVKNAVADVENVIGIGGIESHHRAFVFTSITFAK